MSMRVASDRKTTTLCVSVMAPSRLASFRVLRRCEEGGETWKYTHEPNAKEAESTFVHVSWLETNTSTVLVSHQVSNVGQILVSEHRFSIKLSYVDETVQNRPCCLVPEHCFLFIHIHHPNTFYPFFRHRSH